MLLTKVQATTYIGNIEWRSKKMCHFSKFQEFETKLFFTGKSRILDLLNLTFWESSLTKLVTAITMSYVSLLSDVNSWRNRLVEILPSSPCTAWPAYKVSLDKAYKQCKLDDARSKRGWRLIV